MPTYKFYDSETKETFEDFLSMSTKDELLEKNPHIKQLPTSFGIVSGVGTIQGKTSQGFKEVLSKISEAHPDSPLAKSHGTNRSIKDLKTKAVVDKHMKKWKNQ